MKIDIEKLNRKMPYPEPSEDFFRKIQDNVILRTIGEHTQIPVQKEAKVFALDFKWVAAAAVVLIAGITAFFGLNESNKVGNNLASQKAIDTVYNIDPPTLPGSSDHIASNNIKKEPRFDIVKQHDTNIHSLVASNTKLDRSNVPSSVNNIDRQDYAVDAKKKPEMEVEKVLAAFTPDQIKDLDKNSEQDVYLDLYN